MSLFIATLTPRSSPALRTVVLACLAGLVLALGAEAYHVVFGANLHTVVPGVCYRSAQLSSNKLEEVVGRLGIRTVINLRGANDGEVWYDAEAEVLSKLGVRLVDVRMSGYVLPPDEEFCKLIDALQGVPCPVLVHCHSGSDRSGLASALFLLLNTDADLATARGQVSLRFGHNPFGANTCPEVVLDAYACWLESTGRAHSAHHLQHWVHRVYRFCEDPSELICTSATLDVR